MPDYDALEALADIGGAEAVPDQTEDLRKTRNAPDSPAKKSSRATDHTPPKEPIMSQPTATNEFSALGRTEMFSENILISGPKVPVTVEVAHAPDVGYRIFVQVNGSDVLYLTADQAATLAALLRRDSLVDSESKLVKEIAAAYSSPTPQLVHENGIDTEWGADEVVTVDGDSDTGRVDFIAVADRSYYEGSVVTELWITPQHGSTIKLGSRPDEWHAALDAMTKVVAALDLAAEAVR